MSRGFKKILRCKEHEPLTLPASELLDSSGHFSFYRDVAEKNLFRVEIGAAGIVLRFNAFVGLVPITDEIAVLVEPKAPIGSIFYLIHRSRSKNFRSIGASRPYDFGDNTSQLPEHLIADAFSKLYDDFNRWGLYRRYSSVRTHDPAGRLLVSESIADAFARKSPQSASFETHLLTDDIFENRVIKTALDAVIKCIDGNLELYNPAIVRRLRYFSQLFEHVRPLDLVGGSTIAEIRRNVGRFPAKYQSYSRALWLAYVVLFKREIQIHQVGPASFQSILINMALVFEDFVRAVLKSHIEGLGNQWGSGDGNQNPIPLFQDSDKCNTKPDVYVSKGDKAVLIVDAKYKPSIRADDRYEIIAFMEASGATDAVMVCPYLGTGSKYELDGTTVSGRRIHILRFDLGSTDISAEERWLCDEVTQRFLVAVGAA